MKKLIIYAFIASFISCTGNTNQDKKDESLKQAEKAMLTCLWQQKKLIRLDVLSDTIPYYKADIKLKRIEIRDGYTEYYFDTYYKYDTIYYFSALDPILGVAFNKKNIPVTYISSGMRNTYDSLTDNDIGFSEFFPVVKKELEKIPKDEISNSFKKYWK